MGFPAKRYVQVNSKSMAYVEMGEGDPIVFLHGNPTSSFLWRNIAPHLADMGRCIVPDLIGMGDSEKLDDSGPGRYTFAEHATYLDGLLAALDVNTNVTIVIHDWGSALGFHWANRHRECMKAIAYMEAIVRPIRWDEWPEASKKVFQGMRSESGEAMVLDNNIFVERILPGSVLREMTVAEMDEYRRPFVEPGESRRPTLTWPRQIPLDGEPADVNEAVDKYSQWLAASSLPKLFVNADPGAILTGAPREFCRAWPNQTEITVAGSHFIQEDSPDEIAGAIRNWLLEL